MYLLKRRLNDRLKSLVYTVCAVVYQGFPQQVTTTRYRTVGYVRLLRPCGNTFLFITHSREFKHFCSSKTCRRKIDNGDGIQ